MSWEKERDEAAEQQLQHEIVSDLVRVTSELGRVPSRDEYLKSGKFSQHNISCSSSFKEGADWERERSKKLIEALKKIRFMNSAWADADRKQWMHQTVAADALDSYTRDAGKED